MSLNPAATEFWPHAMTQDMAWAEELVTRFSFDDLEEEDHIEQWLDTMAEIEEEDDEMEEAQRMVVVAAQ